MDIPVVNAMVVDKLRQRSTYVLALVVGTAINMYGQVLVPCLRGIDSAYDALAMEWSAHPITLAVSVFLGYLFPFAVGVYSSVATRYLYRGYESRAAFPDAKPDPVFRANRSGEVVEMGASTARLFQKHGVSRAQDVLGEESWKRLIEGNQQSANDDTTVYFEPERTRYLVTHSVSDDGAINVYLARMA